MKKFDILLIDLNPTKGSEQKWIRPCLLIQNNFANKFARTFVVAVISSVIKDYPHTQILESSKENWLISKSRVDLLQVRTVDESRILKKLWTLDKKYQKDLDEKIKIAFWVF